MCSADLANFQGTMRETLEKSGIFILRRYLGTTRGHDGTQKFFKRKFDTSAAENDVSHVFFGLLERKLFRKRKGRQIKLQGCTKT